jgi:Arc/MetJ-type ribon-helix-helix transcriptional regulator
MALQAVVQAATTLRGAQAVAFDEYVEKMSSNRSAVVRRAIVKLLESEGMLEAPASVRRRRHQ